ncbi:MAG: DNA polymerase III subunit delta' [Luteimonas sp.]
MTAAVSGFAPWQQRAYEHAAVALDSGRMGHALLICGPAQLGKRAVAERLVQRLLCVSRDAQGEPCGQCRGCRLYLARSQKEPLELRPDKSLAQPFGHPAHPDAIFVGYAWRMTPSPPRQLTQIVVEQMRALSERLSKTSQYGGPQVVIIEPADELNEAASNALLKTLEEPQPGRYLWLISENPARLPATIRSRCQKLEFRLPPHEEALAWLRAQGHTEKAVAEALDAARGDPGLADAWLRDGGLQMRREVASDLAKLACGDASAAQTAQRWAADDHASLRLRFAADHALAQAGGLTDPLQTRRLATWFDAANRARALLRTTVRADLAVAELLLAWCTVAGATASGGSRG